MLTSDFVLVNRIIFNRSDGVMMKQMFNMNKMFDELTEVKCLKNNRFQESYVKSLQKTEAYLEPKRASTMELFLEYT